ncbi:MAG: peptide synthetase [Candidatus Entotheonella factor]|uniref:Peptide synthetase n=1 Tax=Entotheonella factor TaxID=1429438 RepID=W4LTC6_ENTF1|nr:MAG: peptide synthetase [Candidatus Entotheonella factor]
MSRKHIHGLFEAQVERTPDAVAVIFEDSHLTYRALNSRANQLARHLQTLGVEPDVPVGICLERSPEMIVGLLGILKAGGAYVPLDPASPAERLAYMLYDAHASVLVTQHKWASVVPDAQRPSVCLDQDWDTISAYPADNPIHDVHDLHLAYVIYTSGSTGKPKGVMISHGALGQFTQAAVAAYALSARDRVLQFASICFDVSVEEIYPCLSCGGTLVLRPDDMLRSVPAFVQTSQRFELTVWDLPTAYWHLVSEVLAKEDMPLPETLRLVIVGGERILPERVDRWHRRVGSYPQLINAYGPTETTVEATIYNSPGQPSATPHGREVPIGRPMGNTRVHVLDANLQPASVADATPGELYIGGDGLARGYLMRPALTADAFRPNPFGEAPGARLYRTGDTARCLPDGHLEFCGRIDHQIKIQGFRVELGEIEAVLSTHPQVSQAVVTAREDIPGDKRLVAYVVPNRTLSLPSPFTSSTLQRFLREKLPPYMVPGMFVTLEQLPLTPNDKLDRQALPLPGRADPGVAFAAPRNLTEETLAGIWAEVLGMSPIGIRDDFFTLGGHSLIAMQILSRVGGVFQIELSLHDLFEHPTIAGLARLIESLHREPMPSQHTRIEPISREQHLLPVSFAQERVYFIQRLAPSINAYQFQEAIRFKGHLDTAILEQSLSEMVRRHEIFRTVFPDVEGQLMQVIHPAQAVRLPVVDLRHEPEREVQRHIDAAIQQPFKLDQLPLIRWTLLRVDDGEHVLIHVEHHMVHDGWSFNLFLRELLDIYQAFSQGRPSPLPDPVFQFADFAHWQRQWVQSEAAQRQLAYWTQKLAGSSPLLELPYDRPRPAEQTYRGGMLRMEVPLELCDALRSLSRRSGYTFLFMTMFAAFLTFLHRYTGCDDLSVGSAVANRRLRETEGLIGMIVNNIVLRADLSGNPTFDALLAQVRQLTLEGYENEDLPFDKVVEALNPVRDLSHNPLFQVMFSFHDACLPNLSLPGLDISLHEAVSNQSAKFDLDIVIIPRSEQRVGQSSATAAASVETAGITAVWEYNSDLFDAATIDRMMGHYQTLLAGIVAHPSHRLSDFPLLTAVQQQQILVTWNETATAHDHRCIHHLFEARAQTQPNATAVVGSHQRLTYQALNAKANQLAHYLRTLGVGPEVLVGIYVERSIDMLVGLLGILKAGGAYVSLDPTYPSERLAFMLCDAQISTLVTQRALAHIATEHRVRRVELDADWQRIAQYPMDNPVTDVQPHHLAYVIYTSGSTGAPKGVMIEHRSLVNFTHAAISAYDVSASDRVLQFASISFDAAAEELYPCLSCGATLVLRTEEMMTSIEALVEASREQHVTVWDLPTAYWHVVTSEVTRSHVVLPQSLRLVIIGGERALPERARQWQQVVGECPKLVNSYGPTEATVVATQCDLSEVPIGRDVPIGRPLDNVELYVLDAYRQPVPIGVPGELYIGGASVARGYLNRPELTEAAFIAHPFRDEPGARLYQTGDWVRYRPDGHLEYVGRVDTQVKLRGLRIELGEIETVLHQHPDVQQAVVVTREDTPGTKRLVTYLTVKGPSPSSHEVRQFLKQHLPDYMVPASVVVLEALPMTSNGKVDTRALPAPEVSLHRDNTGFAPPRDAVEAGLAEIWSDLLEVARVGIHDNFFELGGDSIISLQMVSRARQANLHITPKQLFQYQTIAALAAVAGTSPRVQETQEAVTGFAPLTPIQQWFFEQQLPEPHYFNQSALLDFTSEVEPNVLKLAVGAVLAHHDALRLRVVQQGDGWQPTYEAVDDTIPFCLIDLSTDSAADQTQAMQAAEADLQAGLNLAEGPIVRVAMFRLGSKRADRLLVIVHHLAIDGVSWRLVLEDLTRAYRQLSRGDAVELPPKTTSLPHWAHFLSAYAQSEAMAAERDYWLSHPPEPVRPLPVDHPAGRAHNTVSSAASVTRQLSAQDTRALLQDVPAAYNTRINDVLLTALVQSMAEWTGECSVLVDLEGHGREALFEDADLSRTVGWFTTLFPVCLTLTSMKPVGEALKSIKEQLRRIPNRGIGYGVLRYLSGHAATRAQLRALPQAEVSFNYLGQFDRVKSASVGLGTVREWQSSQSGLGHRSHLLGVSGWISEGQLEMCWTYSEKLHERSTIDRLASAFTKALQILIAHCQSPHASGYTPSDFSASSLSQKKLDKLIGKLK